MLISLCLRFSKPGRLSPSLQMRIDIIYNRCIVALPPRYAIAFAPEGPVASWPVQRPADITASLLQQAAGLAE
ncbi:hypothetical protein AZ23_2773, partial [Bordetella bronchiseptica E010]